MTNVHVRVPNSTICTVDDKGRKHFKWTVDEEATEQRKKNRITDIQVLEDIKKADEISDTYFKLRAKAIISIARIWGKRRGEIALLKNDEVTINKEENSLEINFNLLKKRKMGLFQYIDFLQNKIKKGEMTFEELQSKTQGQIIAEWKLWRDTKLGLRTKVKKSLHSVSLDNPFAKIIIEYIKYLNNLKILNNKGEPQKIIYLFPQGKQMFGMEYVINSNKHLNPQTLLLIVQSIDPDLWMHLYRKKRGSEIATKLHRSIEAVHEVKRELDLEREETAWRYIEEIVAKKADI